MQPAQTHILAIDQGTFSSRACVFDARGALITSHQQAVALNRIDQHHVEQDADELLSSVRQLVSQAVDETTHVAQQVKYCVDLALVELFVSVQLESNLAIEL